MKIVGVTGFRGLSQSCNSHSFRDLSVHTDRRTDGQTDMARSTRLVILIKNIYTLWGRKRFLLPVTYFPTNLVYPFTLRVTGINTETGFLEKHTETLNTGFNIRTSTVPKGPHAKSRCRKPAANASVTGASAPKTAVGIYILTQKGGLPPLLCALILGATFPHLRLIG